MADLTDQLNRKIEELAQTKRVLSNLYTEIHRYLKLTKFSSDLTDYICYFAGYGGTFSMENNLISQLQRVSSQLESEAKTKAEEERITEIVRKAITKIAEEKVDAAISLRAEIDRKKANPRKGIMDHQASVIISE